VGGSQNAGAGVKVGVIDSGIDKSHPCFDDTGYPAQTQLGDTSLTNNKVIVARVFNNTIKKNGLDASAVGYHGHHVAGTIACRAHTPATIDGIGIPYDPSGVAPRALLGNYNVFPGDVDFARSEDILNALQAAYEDGMDIVNMSLGGQQNDGGGGWLLAHAVDNLDKANMLSAVAAGNEGPGNFTVGFPGAAARALTVGASTVGHSIVNQVSIDGIDYEAVVGDFGELNSDLAAPLAVVADPASGFPHGLNLACFEQPPFSPPLPDLTGKIALLGRGTCDFSVKVRAAQDAGAVGVIVVDRVEEPPFVMSQNGDPNQATIPAVMIRLSDGLVAKTKDGTTAVLKALPTYVRDASQDYLMADFSSQGPTMGHNVIVKPDVVAPGANVISSLPASYCGGTASCWGFLSGTSMATPHMAGLAALVKSAHSAWSAADIRSAIVNTAQQGILRDSATDLVTSDAVIVGAGLADAYGSLVAEVALDPVSVSFGSIPGSSGQSKTATLRLTNVAGSPKTYAVTIDDDWADGVLFSGDSTVTVNAGQGADVTISLATVKGSPDGNKQATLRVSAAGAEIAHAVVFVLIGSGTGAPGQHLLPPSQLR
jgi:subtilisin family serine protease